MGSIAKSVTVSIGLISTQVNVTSAKEAQDQTGLINCCTGSGTHAPKPVRRPASCDECGPLAHEGHLVKGRKVGDGVQLLTPGETETLKQEDLQFKGKIDLAPFVSSEVAAHTTQSDKLYFLQPNIKDNRYQTIVQLVRESPEIAFLARYTVRTKASLFWVRVVDNCLLLEERDHEQVLRTVPTIANDAADPKMLKAALAMLPAFVEPFNPETYRSNYRDLLDEMTSNKDVVSTEEIDTVLYSGMSNEDITASIEQAVARGLAAKKAKKKVKV